MGIYKTETGFSDEGFTISAAPERTGYTFQNWNTEEDGTGDQYFPGETWYFNEDTSLYAKWKINQYTMTFDANGGQFASPSDCEQTLNYGVALVAPTPTKTGYGLSGWQPNVPPTVPAENMTFVAQWTANRYQVSFNLGYTSAPNPPQPITVTYDSPYGVLPSVSRTGYAFNGWYYNGAEIKANTTVKTTGNHELTARWSEDSIKITFHKNFNSNEIED